MLPKNSRGDHIEDARNSHQTHNTLELRPQFVEN